MSQVGETLVEIASSNEFMKENIQRLNSVSEVSEVVDEDEVPVWLTKDLLQNSLCNYFKNNSIKVKDVKIMHCGGKGDSFASKMYRVSTYYYADKSEKIEFISCILKTLPQNNLALEKLGSEHYNVQNKEMIFYERLIPKMEEILKTINEDGKTFPTVIAVHYDLDLMILADLTERNFVMANRLKGLNLDHMHLSLKSLARMQAASIIVYERNKNDFKEFDDGFYTRKTDAFNVMFQTNMEVFTEELATWKEWSDCEYYHAKIKALQKTVISNAQTAFDFDENDLNCFNHGDLWTNNIMFRYSKSGLPKHALLLDFQYGFYGSAALDLHYFLYTSLRDKLRLENIDELVQYHYYQLKDYLQRLGYDMKKFPTLQNFQMQVLKRKFYAFSACLLTFPIMISQDADADFEALMGRDERSMGFRRRIYKSPRFKKVAKDILPIFDAKGILDLF